MIKCFKIELVRAIASAFMHGFQNGFVQMLALVVAVPFEAFV